MLKSSHQTRERKIEIVAFKVKNENEIHAGETCTEFFVLLKKKVKTAYETNGNNDKKTHTHT